MCEREEKIEMANMANVLGLIFANMHEQGVPDLTKQRTLASVPFGGRYRMIDFPLSNMVNSDIDNVGIITKDNYLSLMDHLGSGDEWDLSRKTGGMHLLPPYGNSGALYRGRLEAMAQVKPFIASSNAEYVLLSDADVVANIDYRPIIDFHEKNGADITVVYGRGSFTTEQTMTKTVLAVNPDNVITDVLIRPEISGEHNVSLNMFVVSKDFLLNVIRDAESRNLYSFEVDVLQKKLHEIKVLGYKFDKPFAQIDSMDTYFKSNMKLVDKSLRDHLFMSDAPIYTKVRDDAPAKYGIDADVKNSLVADGCIIEGTVENCVLFRGVKIEKGAKVKNCILMQDTTVGAKAEMNFVITDKNVSISEYRSLAGTESYPVFVNKGATV